MTLRRKGRGGGSAPGAWAFAAEATRRDPKTQTDRSRQRMGDTSRRRTLAKLEPRPGEALDDPAREIGELDEPADERDAARAKIGLLPQELGRLHGRLRGPAEVAQAAG